MNAKEFDDLTRILADNVSRRQAIKLIGGGLIGSVLAFWGTGQGEARPGVGPQSETLEPQAIIANPKGLMDSLDGAVDTSEKIDDILTNLQTCLARGFDLQTCASAVAWCELKDQLIGLAYPAWVTTFNIFGAFKTDCGSGECFQCCYVPTSQYGCHTSFVGFPVANCNPLYGAGTRDVGLALIVDPDVQPGDACLFIAQTCSHIPICHYHPGEDIAALEQSLLAGVPHIMQDPLAIARQIRTLAEQTKREWTEYIDDYTTMARTLSLTNAAVPQVSSLWDLANFLTGKGCQGWRSQILSGNIFDWSIEPFKVTDGTGQYVEPASHRNGIIQLGTLRLLASIPALSQRLAYVESRVWTESSKQAYLATVGDPDEALLNYMSPQALEILKQIGSIQDYRLLAVPRPGEPSWEGIFNGCRLGRPPLVKAKFTKTGNTGVSLTLTVTDPELAHASGLARPVMIDWGDGHVTQHTIGSNQNQLSISHTYAAGGKYLVYALVENSAGLRGLSGIVVSTQSQGAAVSATATNIPSVAMVTLDELQVRDLLQRNSIFFSISLIDQSDRRYRVGLSSYLANDDYVDLADIPFGDVTAHNPARFPIKTLIIEPAQIGQIRAYGTLETTFSISRMTFYIYSTANDTFIAHQVKLTKTNMQVFVEGSSSPMPADQLQLDEQGNVKIPSVRRATPTGPATRVDRVEIPITTAMFTGFSLGPASVSYQAGTTQSWIETKPGEFSVVGSSAVYLPLLQK